MYVSKGREEDAASGQEEGNPSQSLPSSTARKQQRLEEEEEEEPGSTKGSEGGEAKEEAPGNAPLVRSVTFLVPGSAQKFRERHAKPRLLSRFHFQIRRKGRRRKRSHARVGFEKKKKKSSPRNNNPWTQQDNTKQDVHKPL